MRSRHGSKKAAVLPEPVTAEPQRSDPCESERARAKSSREAGNPLGRQQISREAGSVVRLAVGAGFPECRPREAPRRPREPPAAVANARASRGSDPEGPAAAQRPDAQREQGQGRVPPCKPPSKLGVASSCRVWRRGTQHLQRPRQHRRLDGRRLRVAQLVDRLEQWLRELQVDEGGVIIGARERLRRLLSSSRRSLPARLLGPLLRLLRRLALAK
eukprot:4005851-Prymnesium_polylepis.1